MAITNTVKASSCPYISLSDWEDGGGLNAPPMCRPRLVVVVVVVVVASLVVATVNVLLTIAFGTSAVSAIIEPHLVAVTDGVTFDDSGEALVAHGGHVVLRLGGGGGGGIAPPHARVRVTRSGLTGPGM